MPDSLITKKALAESLKVLITKKPFAKISISDICDACGMNRRSFYYHFQDKYELVNWIYDSEFLDLMYEKEYASTWAFLLDVYTYFYQNRGFYLSVFAVTGQNCFREYFAEVFTPLVRQSLEPEFEHAEYAAFFAEFYADAMIISLEKWLRDGRLTPEAYVEVLRIGIESTSRRVMRQMQGLP